MIKKHVDDPTKSWEERFKSLETHHIEETTFLLNTLSEVEDILDASPGGVLTGYLVSQRRMMLELKIRKILNIMK